MFSEALPLFVRVTFCAALELPTAWVGKTTLAGAKATVPPEPIPLRFMK